MAEYPQRHPNGTIHDDPRPDADAGAPGEQPWARADEPAPTASERTAAEGRGAQPDGATAAEPVPVQPATAAPTEAAAAPLYRDSDAFRAESERLQAERAARKQARLDALNPRPPVPEPAPLVGASAATATPAAVGEGRAWDETRPLPTAPPQTVTKTIRTADRPGPSLGLFLLRLAVAALLTVEGINNLLAPATLQTILANTVLPSSQLIVMTLGVVQLVVAVMLVFGIGTRLAGLLTAVLAGLTLAFVLWGPWSVFRLGEPGFIGDREVLLAASGLALMFVGGGGWSLDRGMRKGRENRRQANAEA